MMPFWQYLVEKVDQQVFVQLAAEQLLEAVVGEGVDVLVLKRHLVML